jgi:hypothetical protein
MTNSEIIFFFKTKLSIWNFGFKNLYLASLLAIEFIFLTQPLFSVPQISIIWGTETSSNSPYLLKDSNELPLSSGIRGNGDGDLVELGYFSDGTSANPFSGEWTPLTQQTHVGDSSSGYGFNHGMFIFTTNFFQNLNQAVVYPTEPKEYSENLKDPITSTEPPPGTPICIRFYDSRYKAGANYNTVTGSGWLWPSFPNGSSIPTNLYLLISGGSKPANSSWNYGSTFEDQTNAFKTSIRPTYNIQVAKEENSPGNGDIGIGDINTTSVTEFFGEVITLKALPNTPHSEFMRWNGSGIAEPWNKTTTLTVDGDQTVYAEFFAIPYLLNLETQGEGEVSGTGSYEYGDVVPISAYSAPGYSFVRWEKDGNSFSTSADVNFTILEDTDLTAIFARNQYQVSVEETEGGTSVILDSNDSIPDSFGHGLEYTLLALPEPHYGFSSWYSTDFGLAMLGNEKFAQTIFIPTADVNYTAIFSELSYKLNIESTQGYSVLTESGTFPALSSIPVKVEVAEGFVFDYWLDPMGILDDPDSWQTEANISRIYPYMEASISAVLRVKEYNNTDINLTTSLGGSISWETDESGGFTHFKSYELNATSALGYHFDKWEGDIDQLESGAFEPQNKFIVDGPISLHASFQPSEYDITLSSIGNGFASGPETFTISDSPKIEAFSFPGWEFSHWTGNVDFLLNPQQKETFVQPTINSNTQGLSFVANFSPITYEVNLYADGNGSIEVFLSNGNSFNSSESILLSADSDTQIFLETYPAEGWKFSSWVGLPDNTELFNPEAFIDPNSSFSYFYPSKDLNISAKFEFINYQINVESSEGGSIIVLDPDGLTPNTFGHKLNYTLRALPEPNYGFGGWISSPSGLQMLDNENSALTSLIPVADANYTASFNELSYQLNIESDSGYEFLTPSASVPALSLFSVQVNPKEGYVFNYWNDPMSILTDPYSKATEANMSLLYPSTETTIRAVLDFAKYNDTEIDLTSGTGGNISFESDDSGEFTHFQSYEINATAILGYQFDKWIGDTEQLELGASEPNNKVVVNGPLSLKATYKLIEYKINLGLIGGGSVNGLNSLTIHDNLTVSATSLSGWDFSHWSGDTEYLLDPSSDQTLITIIDNAVPHELDFVAHFIPQIYNLNVDTNGEGYFDIYLSNGDEHKEFSSIELSIDSQTKISIDAYPADGWRFTSWSGLPDQSELFNPDSSLDPYSPFTYFYPSKNLSSVVNFELIEYNSSDIVLDALEGGDIIWESEQNGNFLHFSEYPLEATPKKGYDFSKWLTNPSTELLLLNGISSAQNTLKIKGPTAVSASFTMNIYNLTFNNPIGGEINAPSSYTVHDSPLIEAENDPGWEFSHWTGNEGNEKYLVDSNAQQTRINHSTKELIDLSFQAHFVREEYNISLESDGEGTFEISKNANTHSIGKQMDLVKVDSGTRITISAKPSNGWKFSSWIGLPDADSLWDLSPSLDPTNPTIHFIPSADLNISAKYIRQYFTLTTPIPQFGGTPSSVEGKYLFESEVDINATTENHFSFREWMGDTTALKYPSSILENTVVIPDSNISLTPIFEPHKYSIWTFADENGSIETNSVFYDHFSENQTEYNATSKLTVNALPVNSEDHMLDFIKWESSTGTGYSNSPSVTIPFLDNNYSFWAYFVPRRSVSYKLDRSPLEGGTVREDSAYSNTQIQRLISTPAEGYSFLGWSSDSIIPLKPHWSLPNVDAELIETDQIVAHFELQSKFLNLHINSEHGTVTGFSEEVPYGNYLSLKAVPKKNYAFKNWELVKEVTLTVSKRTSSVTPTSPRLFINNQESPELTLARGFTYNFDCNLSNGDKFFISSSPNSEETDPHYQSGISGSLTSNGRLTFEVPIDAPSTLYYHSTADQYSGNKIHITSFLETDFLTDEKKKNPILKERIVLDLSLKANFERTRHNITFTASGQGIIDHSIQDVYFWGDQIDLIAKPEENWYFSHWEENTGIEDPNSSVTKLLVLEDSDVRAVFKKIQYNLNADVTPSEYGSINRPHKTFTYGETVTLTALPKLGMQFDEWIIIDNLSIENTSEKFNQTATFKVHGNAKIEAKFSKIPLSVNIQFSTLDQENNELIEDVGGFVSFPTSIFYGDTLELNPDIYSGYNLLHWIDLDTGKTISSQKNLNLTPTTDQNLKIVLRKLDYNLEINTSGEGLIDNLSNPTFHWGDQVNISASPKAHWEFFRWSGEGSENIDNMFSANATISIHKDSSIMAEFKPKDYSIDLSITPEGFGGISKIDNTYNFGDIVEINASSREGKFFDFWSIEANATLLENYSDNDNSIRVIVEGNAKITAHFESKTYNVVKTVVVVDEEGNPLDGVYAGKILGKETFKDEDNATFSISLNEGFQLEHWIVNGAEDFRPTDKSYNHVMLSDLNLTAIISQRKFDVEVTVSPSAAGYTFLNQTRVEESFRLEGIDYGEVVDISAHEYSGYKFVEWTASGTNFKAKTLSNQSFTVGNNVNLNARFARSGLIKLEILSNPEEAVAYTYGEGTFEYNPEHSILAIAKKGYKFLHWEYENNIAHGIVKEPTSSSTSLILDDDKQLIAVFTLDETLPPPTDNSNKLYLLSISSSNIERGTVSGAGFFRGIRTVKAFPNSGYEFSHWEGASVFDEYSQITEINLSANSSLTAHFQSVGIFDDSEALENGWWGNPWFGYFWKVGEDDWLFHEKLGWIFLKKKSDSSIWVWIQKMDGWFWTAKEHYPYLHSASSQTWYWINLDKSDFTKLVIYDYANAKWLSLQ